MATQAAFMPGTEAARAPSVIWSWLTTVDHKRVGILYGTTAFIFFLIGGLEAVIMRLQVARPEMRRVGVGDILGQDALTLLVPLHAGPQHREDREVGNSHGVVPVSRLAPLRAAATRQTLPIVWLIGG